MNIDHFIENCVAASKEIDPQYAVKEVLARAIQNPAEMLAAVGEPERAGINLLHQSETLEEEPSDGAVISAIFELENGLLSLG